MRLLTTKDSNFADEFRVLLSRGETDVAAVTPKVQAILDEVKQGGDRALLDQIARFDRWNPKSIDDVIATDKDFDAAWEATAPNLQAALTIAYDRIKRFHEKQLPKSWIDFSAQGWLGQKVSPIDRTGLYIPGGKAAYPSSLLMNAIPAIVAGVSEIVVCSPAPEGAINPLALAAARLCGVKRLFKVGGASAIGALAYGTETIPKVDVITGPGNIFVATAKKLVFGEVNIDMIAGPSEIGIIADSSADAQTIAFDLLSQAEHDEMASSILITTDGDLARRVITETQKRLKTLSRGAIAARSINERGAAIVAGDLSEALRLMNQIAPEHLEILTKNTSALLGEIKHAGAIFLGEYSPEAIGVYSKSAPCQRSATKSAFLGLSNAAKSTLRFISTQVQLLQFSS